MLESHTMITVSTIEPGDLQLGGHTCTFWAVPDTRCHRLLRQSQQASRLLWRIWFRCSNTFFRFQRVPECLRWHWDAREGRSPWHSWGWLKLIHPGIEVRFQKVPEELIKNGDTFDIMRLDGLDPMIGKNWWWWRSFYPFPSLSSNRCFNCK